MLLTLTSAKPASRNTASSRTGLTRERILLVLPVCLATMPGEDIQDDSVETGFRLIAWNDD
jgi:hypothetical protein